MVTRGDSRSVWAVRALTAVAFGLFPVLAAAQGAPSTTDAAAHLTLRHGCRRAGRRSGCAYPLTDVLLVETVHHTARNAAIVGAIDGFVVGASLCSQGADCAGLAIGGLFGGAGAGIGALLGAAIDAATANRHVLYASSSPSVRLAPIVAPRAAGVAMTMWW